MGPLMQVPPRIASVWARLRTHVELLGSPPPSNRLSYRSEATNPSSWPSLPRPRLQRKVRGSQAERQLPETPCIAAQSLSPDQDVPKEEQIWMPSGPLSKVWEF